VDSIAFAATNWTFNGGQIPTGFANPTGTIGLTAVNGSATTAPRSDSAPALSQAITPTWSDAHVFSRAFSLGNAPPISVSSGLPLIEIDESDASANNRRWWIDATGGVFQMQTGSDDRNSGATFLSATRSGITVTRVTLATESTLAFVVGTVNTSATGIANVRRAASGVALTVNNTAAVNPTMVVHNEATSGDNSFILFNTEAAGGTGRGSITYNRGGGVVAYNTSCRESGKTNIRPSNPAMPLLAQIPIVAFDWRNSNAKLPYFVTYEKLEGLVPWACQNDGVDVSKLVPLTIKALQELAQRVAALETPAAKGERPV
jgi:hypothetical protein